MITFDPETALTIASSTNTTPIAVTTSTNHGLSGAGHKAFIAGHLGNTNANGQWSLNITGANTFELKNPKTGANSVGNGVGAATGAVIPYTGGGVGIAEDGDDAVASAGGPGATIFSMLAALLDRVAFLRNATVLDVRQYTGNDTDVVPDGTVCTLVYQYGAGGQGGGGAGGQIGTTATGCGGAGGGQARGAWRFGVFPPRSSQAVVIGTCTQADNHGPTGADATQGNGGGDTSYGGTLVAPGGGGGAGGKLSGSAQFAIGGAVTNDIAVGVSSTTFVPTRAPGEGGLAQNNALAGLSGNKSSEGFAGGTGGAAGGTDGTHLGGGGGGGGGGGPGGVGGNGAAGGDGVTGFSTAAPGGVGFDAAANTGAGGGGGGAGGDMNTGTNNVGGKGGKGGSGKQIVIHLGAPQ